MKRGILIGGGVLIVLIGGAAYFLYTSLDTLIQAAVEHYGSETTQAKVTLEAVEVDPISGKGALSGLVVGNPKGFETAHAVALGQVRIHLDTGSITGDPVVIKEIVVDRPAITFEISDQGNNIDTLRKNVGAYLTERGIGQGSGDGGGPKLIVENLYIRGGTVNVSATILAGQSLSAPLPDIHLTDIGKEDGGASPGEIAERIIEAVADAATAAVGGLGIGKTLDSLKQALGGVAGSVGKSVGDAAKGVTEGVTEGLGKSLGPATEAVGGFTEGVGKTVGQATEGIGKEIGAGAEKVGKKIKGLFKF